VQLLLIRHALPVRAHVESGTADPELTDLGRQQADALTRFLQSETVDAIASSPMRRAQETARPLSLSRELPVEIHDDLAEYDSGQQSYVPVHELREADPALWQQMLRGDLPDHVDLAAFRARVISALERIADAHPGRRTVAVFCHAGVMNAALSGYLEIARGLPFAMDYCGVSRILAGRDGRRSVLSVNETGHVRSLLATVESASPR
jgi:2,3-bisphosphoglycerate-dependent phosphoglycerate mutase